MSEPTPPRPALPVGRIPIAAHTPMTAAAFGQAIEAWLVGTKFVSITTLIDAATGCQTLLLEFDGPDRVGLVIKDKAEPGLDVRIVGSCRPQGIRYLSDAEVDALVAARRGPGESSQELSPGPPPADRQADPPMEQSPHAAAEPPDGQGAS
jgi:hypothetical protein